MIEVFKTNVTEQRQAAMLIDRIHKTFVNYTANFDLEDCDKILRVKCSIGWVQAEPLIDLLKDFGFQAEVLPENDIPIFYQMLAQAQSLSTS
ncbi:MAG TPA: hypothetical protein VIN08_20315 [Ohtaekwangia sp.]|uniref:hypothetical protein n=1 Tax=Ohtaekwangia sp. TaxID=2066019 RepID=UPI002F957CFE